MLADVHRLAFSDHNHTACMDIKLLLLRVTFSLRMIFLEMLSTGLALFVFVNASKKTSSSTRLKVRATRPCIGGQENKPDGNPRNSENLGKSSSRRPILRTMKFSFLVVRQCEIACQGYSSIKNCPLYHCRPRKRKDGSSRSSTATAITFNLRPRSDAFLVCPFARFYAGSNARF